MKTQLGLLLLCSALAFASGTVTPKKRAGSARCATSTLEGVIANVDLEHNRFSVAAPNSRTRDFNVAPDTQFRVPGATREDLKNAPLSKVSPNARVKVFYCTKDGSPVEVKVER